jgi:glutamate N-acetyltransferase / amino-acid N-acetyltransferase
VRDAVKPLLAPSALPTGYTLAGLRCGISNKPGKKDIALFYSSRPAVGAAVFTKNLVKAAPVLVSRRHVLSSKTFRGVLINSGCANACTGPRGLKASRESLKWLSAGLGVRKEQLLVASTGVIGRQLPLPPLRAGVRRLAAAVRRGGPGSPKDAVEAIMTTDIRPKAARFAFPWQGRTVTVWGCAKGAGMIHPDMVTMLFVVLTDAGLPRAALREALAWAADRSFNRLSVDGDTSTNDTVFLLDNGAPDDSPALRKTFRSALQQVCLSLARQIAADGEGARRVAWIFVEGARTEAEAKKLAAVVATSPLVKTALHGADPNWGRVVAALGRGGVPFDPDRVEVRFGDMVVFRRGQPTDFSAKAAHKLLDKDEVTVRVDLGRGKAWSNYVTCDFSKEYVSINADYTT